MVAACGGGPTVDPVAPTEVRTTPLTPAPRLVLSEQGFGPITGGTRIDYPTLEALFPGFELKPARDGGTDRTVAARRALGDLELWRGGVEVVMVVRDTTHPDAVFNVQGYTADVVGPPGYTIGGPVTALPALDACDCWGEQPICFVQGHHLGVVLDGDCGSPNVPRNPALQGRRIQRLVWSKPPLQDDADRGAADAARRDCDGC